MWEPSSSSSLTPPTCFGVFFVIAEMIQPKLSNFLSTFLNIVVPYLRSDRKIAWVSFDLQEHKTHNNVSLVMEHPLDLWAKKAAQSEIASPITTGQILIELSLHLSYWLPAPLTTWWWYPAAKRLNTMQTIRWTTLQCGIFSEQSDEQHCSEQSDEQCRVESEIACLQLSKPPLPPILP